MNLLERMKDIRPLCQQSMAEAEKRWDNLAKPLKSLGTLESDIIQIAGICRAAEVCMERPLVVVFCADNGVVKQGVTQVDSHVTAIVAENITHGDSTVCVMGRQIGAKIWPVDIGIQGDLHVPGILQYKVRHGTRDMTEEPTLTREEVLRALEVGIELAERAKAEGFSILVTGEMGIGNTTTSSAVAAVLLHETVETVTGRGAGLSDEGLRRKVAAIHRAIVLHRPNADDPIDVLAKVGGLDIAGMAGLYLGGALAGIPVVMDGFISAVAALIAIRLAPLCRDYILPSHVSAEPAGQLLLQALDFSPRISCGMRLGEGTGGVAAVALLQMGTAVYHSMRDFESAGVDRYTPQS